MLCLASLTSRCHVTLTNLPTRRSMHSNKALTTTTISFIATQLMDISVIKLKDSECEGSECRWKQLFCVRQKVWECQGWGDQSLRLGHIKGSGSVSRGRALQIYWWMDLVDGFAHVET